MKKAAIVILFLFISCNDYGQLKHELKLSSKLRENSGIEKISEKGLLWIVEDSGNKDHIYGVNDKGKIVKEINIKNAKNVDWEDLTKDEDGNLYIGDFGNNNNDRKDLRIYKVSNPDKTKKEDLEATRITFYYPEQYKFPPKKDKLLYDAEALIYYNEYLYIFTKNRTKPFNGKTLLYKIPAKEGNHRAELIDSFTTCDDFLRCAITSAAISPDKKRIALLAHDKVWLFSNFKGDNFFEGDLKEIFLDHYSQKESICFKNNSTLLISDEDNIIIGRNLYSLKFKN
ncbi:hypothetical protein GTQ40_10220 [Flavobacteriaceae bacterium R38]|nr:hypothetical protein [Flavobacteriaceae bacterium R38]